MNVYEYLINKLDKECPQWRDKDGEYLEKTPEALGVAIKILVDLIQDLYNHMATITND